MHDCRNMTDYLDLIQYGSIDLQRSEESFKNGDYNLAAFCAQQSLEKYLKAYMVKFEIFENIQQLGHLQYPTIIEKMINWMKDGIDDAEGPYRKFLKTDIEYLEFVKKILNEINDSYEKKIIFWKDSLGIPHNKQEDNISEGIYAELMKNVSKLQKSTLEFLQSDPFGIQNIDVRDLDEEQKFVIGKINSVQENMMKAAKSIDSDISEINMIRDDIGDIFEKFAYGSGRDSFSKEETATFQKYLKIWRSVEWMWVVIESYPHVVISRYPIQIDGKDPILLYEENKENLWKLIQKIKKICLEIKESCN